MTLVPELLRSVQEVLDSPAGRVGVADAAVMALQAEGSPTRPYAPPGRLLERRRAGLPLSEDTDWRAPLGEFRDRSIVAGTLRELCGALLTTGEHGVDVMTRALLPVTARSCEPWLAAHARDEAEARAMLSTALRTALLGPLSHERLDTVLAWTDQPWTDQPWTDQPWTDQLTPGNVPATLPH